MRNNGRNAVQGHSRSTILVPFKSSYVVCDFLLVNNTNLRLIFHRFQVIAEYWSNFCYWNGRYLYL